MSTIPTDSYMLFSFVNTKLRDEFSSLDDFCAAYDCAREEIEKQLAAIGYYYDKEGNSFKRSI